AYYVLLSSSGKSIGEISAQLSRNPHTVRCWIKRYLHFGISGLIDKNSSGRPNQLREKVKEELNQLLSVSPKEYGYQQSGWQINLQLDQLTKTVGSVSATTVKRALHEHGWVYKRYSKKPPLNAPSKEDKAAYIEKMVASLSKQKLEHEIEILFADESHFSNEPYVERGWFKRGEKKPVHTNKMRESKTLFGALSLSSQAFYWKQAERGTLRYLFNFYINYIKAKPNKKIVMIIDNGSIHRSKKVSKFVKKHEWVELFFLPPYSPEYNPIELFWKWLKRKIYGANGFTCIEQLIARIRKFIWHYNENKFA
ncbi:TPA: IS630 family transposase, partial [Legionella pneumophila]